ncbi:hypothetical protein [Herpetosiphon gulosus]|uniref:Uncharacterized protein n=1 Tax=Herpetosiphon gulosus TaxID=1973496 RepID=A0ABP9X699_9CHLR
MIDIDIRNRVTTLEREVFALRSELRSLRNEVRQGSIPQNKMRHQPTTERNLAPEREPEALVDVAQQLSEQVSSEEIGAYLKRRRVTANDIQLTEQDLERNRTRKNLSDHSKLAGSATINAFYSHAHLFIILFGLIMLLVLLLTML